MIKWKNICQSRCAIDSLYDWLNEDLTDNKLIRILEKLGFKEDAIQFNKYLLKWKHSLLISNIKQALRRHKV